MSELITQKINIALSVINVFNLYFAKASLFINVVDSNAMIKVKKLIDQNNTNHIEITTIVKELQSLDTASLNFDDLCRRIFEIYKTIKEFDIILDEIHELLSVDIRVHEKDISTTASVETLNMLNKVLLVYTDYIAHGNTLNNDILLSLAKMLSSKQTNTMEYIKITQSYYRQNDLTVELYAVYLNLILSQYYRDNDSRRYEIIEQIEEDKTWQLLQYDIEKWNKIRFKDIFPRELTPLFITEWGIMPQSILRPLKEIFQKLFNAEINMTSPQKVVDHVAKLQQTGINLIIIEKIMPRAVEHDITKVVGRRADTYSIPDRSGLNNKTMDKFNTLTIRTTDLWKFNVTLYESSIRLNKFRTLDCFYIIETIDNMNYRILLPYAFKNTYAVQGKHITKLMRYIKLKKSGDFPDHSRITEYNKLLELELYKNLKATPKMMLQDIAINAALKIDIGMVRQTIKTELIKVYDTITPKIKTKQRLRDIIFEPALIEHFIESQISIYNHDKQCFKLIADPTLQRKKFNQNDVFATFLLHASGGIRNFQREMNENYYTLINEMSSDEINRWSPSICVTQFKIIFEKIIDVSLSHLFTSENNVYQGVRYKTSILNAI